MRLVDFHNESARRVPACRNPLTVDDIVRVAADPDGAPDELLKHIMDCTQCANAVRLARQYQVTASDPLPLVIRRSASRGGGDPPCWLGRIAAVFFLTGTAFFVARLAGVGGSSKSHPEAFSGEGSREMQTADGSLVGTSGSTSRGTGTATGEEELQSRSLEFVGPYSNPHNH